MEEKYKGDKGKLMPLHVPTELIRAVAKVREYGIKKYGNATWKYVATERYVNALYRHLLSYIDNPGGNDEESGLPIMAHIACNAAFILELDKKHHEEVINNG